MNTAVNFELAKWLKEKEFDLKVRSMYCEKKLHEDTNSKGNYNDVIWVRTWRKSPYDDTVSAPTIAEVIMWLYEKHGIWIGVIKHTKNGLKCFNPYIDNTSVKTDLFFNDYDFPTEAYEAAIHYIKENNLI